MSTILGRSLRQIQQSLNVPHLDRGAIVVAVHESAHAVVALTHGIGVKGLSVRVKGGYWVGHCSWEEIPDDDIGGECFSAGAASLDLLSPTLRQSDDPWDGAEDDRDRLLGYGIGSRNCSYFRASAWAILNNNRCKLDQLATALLRNNGQMDESEIRRIAWPGMPPDPNVALSSWTSAQRHKLADDIELMVRNGNAPRKLLDLVDEYGEILGSNPRAREPASTGIRFGAPVPIEPALPRASAGYQHRMRGNAR